MGFCSTDISREIISKVIAPSPSIIDGLIGQGPEIQHCTRWLRRIRHPLGQQNSGEILGGDGIPRRALAPIPAEPARHIAEIVTPGEDRETHAPASVGTKKYFR